MGQPDDAPDSAEQPNRIVVEVHRDGKRYGILVELKMGAPQIEWEIAVQRATATLDAWLAEHGG